MTDPAALLTRLDEIGRSLAASGRALALLGLGSVGLETSRLDAYSDLDFFAIVETGQAERYINNLDWLSQVAPIAYQFRNTADGCKLLFADGIFCEFAVFEPAGLANAAYLPGRVVWQRADAPPNLAIPHHPPAPRPPADPDWSLGEALTNLYVGLGRYRRGEKLIAQRFIQHYAVDRLLELADLLETPGGALADPYGRERRFEQRYPGLAGQLGAFIPGYEHSPQAARAILAFLEAHFPVNPALAAAIRALAE